MCNRFAVGGLTHPGCRKPWGLDGLTAIFSYQGLIKKAIKKLKYKFVTDLTEDLLEGFLSFCGENPAFVEFCRQDNLALIPIPLHPFRLRWRGFNQSELLGEMIAKNLGIKFFPNLLLRVKESSPQAELAKKERIKNIRGVFKINSKFLLLNSCFLLFDDIWTTGATLREAGKVLKRNGAKKVWGLTLAR